MTIKKIVLPVIAGAVVLGAGAFGATRVLAQTSPNTYPPIVQKIAARFGLNISDVQAVFNQDRQDRQAQMETKYEQYLAQLVTDGKITAAQQQLILTKHKEMMANRQTEFANMKSMTPEQRKTAMDQQRQDLENWAKQNNIDPQYLFGGMRMGMHMGGRMDGMGGPMPTPQPGN